MTCQELTAALAAKNARLAEISTQYSAQAVIVGQAQDTMAALETERDAIRVDINILKGQLYDQFQSALVAAPAATSFVQIATVMDQTATEDVVVTS